ncbi:MAG: hypothetical protein ACYTDW_04020 [Planctomycetota bacterium]|jgi:hypothetical protein
MIKTLRITTIIAAILAIGFLAFPVVYGYRGNEQIEQFLKSPGAIEKFNKAKGVKSRKTGDQTSPLVKQAVLFGLYLNPPPRKAAPRPKTTPTARKPAPITEVPVVISAKFKLIGTSYYASRPELSLAYIDEPGKGLYWTRQGSKVGHLLIEKVKDGSIVVKDREKTVTLVAVRAPKKSLIKGETTSKSTPSLPGASASITSNLPVQVSAGKSAKPALDKPTAVQKRAVTHGASRRPPQMSAAEQNATLADFIKKLKVMQSETGSGKGNSENNTGEEATLRKAIATFENMRITTKEANRLDRLGKELKSDPNRVGNSKIQRSRGPQPPRPPQPPGRSPRRLPR